MSYREDVYALRAEDVRKAVAEAGFRLEGGNYFDEDARRCCAVIGVAIAVVGVGTVRMTLREHGHSEWNSADVYVRDLLGLRRTEWDALEAAYEDWDLALRDVISEDPEAEDLADLGVALQLEAMDEEE